MSTTRSKPRLAKLKKPLGFQKGTSKSVLKETDSGFNPFVSAPTSTFSNGFRAFGCDYDFVNSRKNEGGGIRATVGGGSTGFVFGAERNEFGLNSRVGKSELGGNEDGQKFNFGMGSKLEKCEDTSDSGVNLSSENRDTNSGHHQNVEFVFGENPKCFPSSSTDGNKDQIDSVEKLSVDDTAYNGTGVQKEVSSGSFVFGASCERSETSSNTASLKSQAEVKVGAPSSGCHTRGMGEVHHGVEDDSVFMFGKCFSQNYAFDKGVSGSGFSKPEKSKLSSESLENSDHDGKNGAFYLKSSKTVNGFLNNDADEKGEFVFGRSNALPKTSVNVPIFKLPDEMSKLNINDPGNFSNTDPCKGSASADFSFGSFLTASQADDSNCPESADAVEKTTSIASNGHDFGASSRDKVESMDGLNFNSPTGKSVPSSMDFGTEKWDPSGFKENLLSELNTKIEFSSKCRSVPNRLKKTGRKFRQSSISRLSTWQNFVPHGSTCPENSESPGSPMDFSPYQETVASDLCSGSNMKALPVSFPENESAQFAARSTPGMRNGASTLKEGFDISRVDEKCSETFKVNSSSDTNNLGRTSGLQNGHLKSNAGTSVEAGGGASFDSKGHDGHFGVQFSFASGFEDMGERSFSFSASPSAQVSSTAKRRQYRKKNRFTASVDAIIISPRSNDETLTTSFESLSSSASSHLQAVQCENDDSLSSQYKVERNDEHVKKGSISASAAIWEACDKWRLRGNQAYEKRELSQAEEFYTRGIRSVPRRERSGCFLEPLVLCYSNRAAARMSLGRIREALGDCMRATTLDSNFLKAPIRAANCHLLLGEVEEAIPYFRNCLKSGIDVCLDRRIVIDASDGLQKAQKVAACTKLCAEILQQRASTDESNVLTLVEEALTISPYSEKLLEIKAEIFYMLQMYEEVIQLCEQTLTFAENVFHSVRTNNKAGNRKANDCKNNLLVRRWRQRMISKSYFHLGKLEAALDILEKQEHLGSTADNYKDESMDSPIPLAVTVRELLHRKTAGNEAFQSGRYAEALEHYTTALSTSVHSRPFTAVCFCNRAAARQALGQIGDAIADCSLAIALDVNYSKAVSRRATLHEMIRDYAQAANDLQRYITIIEKKSREKSKDSDESKQTILRELKQARRRLSSMEAQGKKDIPLDLYLILGIKVSDTASEIKKAYRKAALRHHPDKAGQFLARSESEDDGRLWKEIAAEVHKDTERLFKMIGEANAVLSDPAKRSAYDMEEETRKSSKSSNKSSTYNVQPNDRGYPFEQRNWQDTWWKSHGSSYSRW